MMSEERCWKYLDGEMEQDEKSAFEALLRKDEKSKQTFLELRSLHLKIREANVVKAPKMLKKELMTRLIPEKRSAIDIPLISKGNWIAAACIFIMITGTVTLMSRSMGFDPSDQWFYSLDRLLDMKRTNMSTYLAWTVAIPFFILLDKILRQFMKPKLSGYH